MVVAIMVIWIKFTHSSPFLFAYSSISCLTTSNLPWFMDLIFQIPMQYCSLQHWTLLPSPVTSTTGHCLAPCLHSFWCYFFTLLLWSALGEESHHRDYLGHEDWSFLPWGVHLSVSYIFAFSFCTWGFQGKNTKVVYHCLHQRTTFCQNSPPWPIHLWWPYMVWLIFSLSKTFSITVI